MSGITLDATLDGSWRVATFDEDGPCLTFHDDATSSAVTLRGEALIGLLETALPELVDVAVQAAQRAADLRLAVLAEQAERVVAYADEELRSERLATPDEMEVGGWLRPPGQRVWRQILDVRKAGPARSTRVLMWSTGPLGDDEDGVSASKHDTLPYRSDDEMRAAGPIPSDDYTPPQKWGNGLLDSFTGPESAA